VGLCLRCVFSESPGVFFVGLFSKFIGLFSKFIGLFSKGMSLLWVSV